MELSFEFILLGILLGTISGMVPGVGMAVLLVVSYPFLIELQINDIIQFYISAIITSQFCGSLVATYFAIPGEASSIPAVIEGHSLAKEGKVNQAIFISAFGSLIGGIVAFILLSLLSLFLIKIFSHFNTVFNVFLITVVFIFLFVLPTKNYIEKFIFPLIGFILALVGTTPHNNHDSWLTFGIRDLEAGFPLMSLMLGVYSLPLLIVLGTNKKVKENIIQTFSIKDITLRLSHWVISFFYAVYGFFLAFVPGIGLDIVSNTAHKIQKVFNNKFNLQQEKENNLLAAETANNSGAFSILLPLLAFGLPTNTSQAILNDILINKNYLFGALNFNQSLINSILFVIIFTSISGFILAGPFSFLLAKIFKKLERVLYPLFALILVGITIYMGYKSLNLSVYVITLTISFIFGYFFRFYDTLRILYFFMITPFFVENWLRLLYIVNIL